MLFNSWLYVLFLLLAAVIYWTAFRGRGQVRYLFISACSLVFYSMWRWEFVFLLLFSAAVDFWCARAIHASQKQGRRKAFLLISLSINLGLLLFFKYAYFIYDNIRFVGSLTGQDWPGLDDLGIRIILPLGISFYTFQTISYTIDVYRGIMKPVERYALFLAYVTFWPQLIAGPILRAGEVIPQLRNPARPLVAAGTFLILAGLFKKVVLADGIAPMVDLWFGFDPATLTALDAWVASFLFGFQIYFDFSGYSDIAIGSALLFGMVFPRNFFWPYMATSPREFWQRWHISLSSWIRDYLYLPLTGSRFRTRSEGGLEVATTQAASGRRDRALLLTWLIMGLWHGAAWNFAIWGLYHGVVVLLFRRLGFINGTTRLRATLSWAVTLPIMMAGWIPFRSTSVEQTLTLWAKMLDPSQYAISHRITGMSSQLAAFSYLWAFFITLGMAAAYAAFVARTSPGSRLPLGVQWVGQSVLVALMLFGVLLSLRITNQFIYFQF